VKLIYTNKFEDGTFMDNNKDIPSIYDEQLNTREEAGDTSQIGVESILNGIEGIKQVIKKLFYNTKMAISKFLGYVTKLPFIIYILMSSKNA